MAMRTAWLNTIAFIVALAAACGSDREGSLGQKLDMVVSEKSANSLIGCRCYDHSSSSRCEPDDLPSAAARECLINALQTDEATSTAYLDCMYAAFKAEDDCLTTAGYCGTDRGETTCSETYDSAEARCYLPQAIEDATDRCGH
jgi:hypothetical protein